MDCGLDRESIRQPKAAAKIKNTRVHVLLCDAEEGLKVTDTGAGAVKTRKGGQQQNGQDKGPRTLPLGLRVQFFWKDLSPNPGNLDKSSVGGDKSCSACPPNCCPHS